MATANSIPTVYNAFWDCLESKTDFVALFPNGTPHQVRYKTSLEYAPSPEIESPAPADYPMCRVVIAGFRSKLSFSNTHSILSVLFKTEVCTGQEYQSLLWDAAWAIYRGHATFQSQVIHPSGWNASRLAADIHDEEVQLTNEDQTKNRGTNQWVGICSFWVDLQFPVTDLEDD